VPKIITGKDASQNAFIKTIRGTIAVEGAA
jgi:hypothetical protein